MIKPNDLIDQVIKATDPKDRPMLVELCVNNASPEAMIAGILAQALSEQNRILANIEVTLMKIAGRLP